MSAYQRMTATSSTTMVHATMIRWAKTRPRIRGASDLAAQAPDLEGHDPDALALGTATRRTEVAVPLPLARTHHWDLITLNFDHRACARSLHGDPLPTSH